VVGKTKETFQNNNFTYSAEKNGVHVTLFENNYINLFRPNTYEATLIYLIRQKGDLAVYTDHHLLGLFPQATWKKVFTNVGLTLRKKILNGMYDPYIIGDGEYPLTIFIGLRP
jgi:hypothetical protein